MAPAVLMVKASIKAALDTLLTQQNKDGHWRYDMECFVLTTALHIISLHYANEILDLRTQEKKGNYLRRNQLSSGGWGLAPNEKIFVSNSVLAYFALKLIGDRPDEEHMIRAREAILKAGGAEGINITTRFYLALFGIVPWSCVLCIPVEIMLLPQWFPVTIYKVSYWARVSFVPMSVLQALNKRPKRGFGITLDELFIGKPSQMKGLPRLSRQNKAFYYLFSAADKILKYITPYTPSVIRAKAMSSAIAFCKDRLNGEDGLGSIMPAMYYILMMYEALDYAQDHPDRVMARAALNRFIVVGEEDAFTVSCFSPTWDTSNVITALLNTGEPRAQAAVEKALEYLRSKQILDFKGDWAQTRPNLRPGGWAFFYGNPHYPDTEDTAAVVLGMHRMSLITGSKQDQNAISRGTEWILGMQSQNGGWAPYDADSSHTYLNNIPAALEDYGSLLDLPSVNVTSNIVITLIGMGHMHPSSSEAVQRAIDFILGRQKPNGSWYGRWGVNYVYGTRLALCALTSAGLPLDHPSIVKGVAWLLSVQNEDGGWGEGFESYNPNIIGHVTVPSTASQTSWALLALLCTMDVDHPAIVSGIKYLLETQGKDGQWLEEAYTGTAFPGLLMLRYYGYPKYFPLQALTEYSCKLKLK